MSQPRKIDLDHIAVVMVRPRHPGNIGAAARAMKNMGVSDLRLVDPYEFPHPNADDFAANGVNIVRQATVYATVAEAVADRVHVFATTARTRRWISKPIEIQDIAPRVATSAEPTAILFGTERSGLTNEDLEAAEGLLTIPTAEDGTSLNVAQAVLTTLFALRQAGTPERPAPRKNLASAAQVEHFNQHLFAMLEQVPFFNPQGSDSVRLSLREIFQRAELTTREAKILEGVVKAIEYALDHGPQSR
ncbi:MAG: tRNA (cytosine(32)/uridine(32)-2'-O)-methyltransferase TrmJ [Alphaproteobacteria bacterium CG_4_10_14_0_2_um_filter_63_37]|nr:MAG: hypothetical protein AUJ55_07710 [Proteobacteria bacterium CG1_02_64_396]PJA24443.1 MAG: tRNA (cytosine(32)/uridine(32)-2'-O)-methyltransferase TrmJ [Alphaproteobacteria bacterium CG_4_10_14_0_2_um_filter_63_37]